MKSALIISFSDLASDPRVNRQIRLLSRDLHVTAMGFGNPGVKGVTFIALENQHWPGIRKLFTAAMLKGGYFERTYWSSNIVRSALRSHKVPSADLVLANDIAALPLALKLAGKAKVIFDSHEYAPAEFEGNWKWRFFLQQYMNYLCKRYLSQAAAMTTVCEGIADLYSSNYQVAPKVVRNTPPYQKLSPSPTGSDTIRLIHHGAAIPSRRTELMIDMMSYLDHRFTLDLVLMPSVPRYYESIAARTRITPRVRLLSPTPMHSLPALLNHYDVGVYLLQADGPNHKFSLPNKFFEFVQARLAVAIGPSPEMSRLVRAYDLGIVAPEFTPESLAKELMSLNATKIDYHKSRADVAARDLCYENDSRVLMDIVDSIVASG